MNQYQQTVLRLIYSGFSTNHIHKMSNFDHELKFLSFQNEFSEFIYRFGLKYNLTMDKYHHFLNSDILYIKNEIRDRNIQLVFSDDVIYPKLLKEIYDYPFLLFCKGDISLLNNKKKLAIVGARNATTYTEQICNALIPELVDAQITIVSGMAKGADYFAHLKAIENGGHTIGVAAFGLDYHYPNATRYINEWMRKHHLIVSEYYPSTKVQKWRFPERNRIISGLSQGVLVTEANNRSGSLITVDQALDQNRNVYCCPGSIFNELSRGVNKRIQEGAKAVQKAQDIIEDFKVFYD
ncbi:DNA-processing protein DprA [Mammaliicoccus sp. Dog046]|uniref:DNA-processing protein DprA n=1 Tax=Mammaliicoccus sp. Dog046 TaxID=3034233 RepID=UPI002B2634C9|nr:DNA-processing protein DprA [Mammaliicoccus sp. Dog046]WQK84559.1 DNA-processing protein DprA [Mammaliicoccus sp. Dog046]